MKCFRPLRRSLCRVKWVRKGLCLCSLPTEMSQLHGKCHRLSEMTAYLLNLGAKCRCVLWSRNAVISVIFLGKATIVQNVWTYNEVVVSSRGMIIRFMTVHFEKWLTYSMNKKQKSLLTKCDIQSQTKLSLNSMNLISLSQFFDEKQLKTEMIQMTKEFILTEIYSQIIARTAVRNDDWT